MDGTNLNASPVDVEKSNTKIELGGSTVGTYGYRKLDITVEYFDDQTKYLVGRLKTIIDAAVADKQQNKALKDLIAIEVWGRRNYIVEELGVKSRIINDGQTDIV